MKPLLKSLREANRYVLCEFAESLPLYAKSSLLYATFFESCTLAQLARADISFIPQLSHSRYFVLVTNAKSLGLVQRLIAQSASAKPIRIIRIGGTLKHIKAQLKCSNT